MQNPQARSMRVCPCVMCPCEDKRYETNAEKEIVTQRHFTGKYCPASDKAILSTSIETVPDTLGYLTIPSPTFSLFSSVIIVTRLDWSEVSRIINFFVVAMVGIN